MLFGMEAEQVCGVAAGSVDQGTRAGRANVEAGRRMVGEGGGRILVYPSTMVKVQCPSEEKQ